MTVAKGTDRETRPAESTASAVSPDHRLASIDALRGIALFGVLVVNLVTEFRVSIFEQFLGTRSARGTDRLVELFVSWVLESKAFCLFALLFGVGLAIQFDRLSRHGSPLYWLVRRLVVLLAFGLVHLLLIWNGDILTEYALAGLLALPMLLLRPKALLLAALSLLALYAAGPIWLYSIAWPDAAVMRQHVALANQVYSTASLAEIWRFSHRELALLLPLHVFVFPRTLALFLLGAFLWRAGILVRLREFRHRMAIAAVVGIGAGAALTMAGDRALLGGASGAILTSLAPVALALGYGAAVMALAQASPVAPFLRPSRRSGAWHSPTT